MKPSPDQRAFLLVAFAIQALELLSCLATEACYGPRPYAIVEQQYYAAKRQVLFALYEAMATRAQQSWVAPFPVLAEFSSRTRDSDLDTDAALAEQLNSPEFTCWYEQRKANGELGLVLDSACDLLEGKAPPAKRRPKKPVEQVNVPNIPVSMRSTPLKRSAPSDTKIGSKSSPVVIDSDSDSFSDASVKEIEKPSHPTKRCRLSEVKIKQEAAQNNDREAQDDQQSLEIPRARIVMSAQASSLTRKVTQSSRNPTSLRVGSDIATPERMKNLSRLHYGQKTNLSAVFRSVQKPTVQRQGPSHSAATSLSTPTPTARLSSIATEPTETATSLHSQPFHVDHMIFNGPSSGSAPRRASTPEGNFTRRSLQEVENIIPASPDVRANDKQEGYFDADDEESNNGSVQRDDAIEEGDVDTAAQITIDSVTKEQGIHEMEPVNGGQGEQEQDVDEEEEAEGEEDKDEDEAHENGYEKVAIEEEEQDENAGETEDDTEDEKEEQEQHQEDKENEDLDAAEKEIKGLLKKKKRVEEKLTKIEYRIIKLMKMQRVKQQELKEKALQAQREQMQAEQRIQMQIQQQMQSQEQTQSKTQTRSRKPDLESQLRAAIDKSHSTPRATPRVAPPVAQHRVRTSGKSASGPTKPKRLSMASSNLVSPSPLAKHRAVTTPDGKVKGTSTASRRTSEASDSPYGKMSPQRYHLFTEHLTSLITSGKLFGSARREEALHKCFTAVNKLMHNKMKKGKAAAGSKSEDKFSLREVSAAFVYLAKKKKVVLKGEGVRLIEGEW
ncbi:hypothetical protein E8E13_006046 [Curvularia kusanoi]|uniref:Uncharacterized protein n=1 Tax=Curvularia kusanoi TaxID=90978 RepID=A0A9P4TAH5_CURKU|nr:hypothetical protein E8E13_006046 [Curvularia kusanoi]